MDIKTVLRIKDLSVIYTDGQKTKKALDNISFELHKGEIIGLLGPNGAGKTTLIKTLLGFLEFKDGEVEFFGQKKYSKNIRAKIGFMPEIANYPWFLTPAEILDMFGRISGMRKNEIPERIENTLKTVELYEQRNDLVKSFSKGMQERLNLAQAILHDPELLILDEPFSGLDPIGRIKARGILTGLRDKGKTLLLSSHELSEAELMCDKICIISRGKVLHFGAIGDILHGKGETSLENYFISIIGDGK